MGGDATHAVATLHAAWNELVAASPATFHTGRTEPDLTEILCLYLKAIQQQSRLTGLWAYEGRQGKLIRKAGGLKVVQRKRTDIQYFSNREDPVLNLIFEFKKLGRSKSQRDKYTGAEGMLRFVTGEYSIGEPLALMVGILVEHQDDCVPPLDEWLNSEEARELLRMELVDGRQTRSPSDFFSTATFDTEHLRPRRKAPKHGTIVISHLFVGFPGSSSHIP